MAASGQGRTAPAGCYETAAGARGRAAAPRRGRAVGAGVLAFAAVGCLLAPPSAAASAAGPPSPVPSPAVSPPPSPTPTATPRTPVLPAPTGPYQVGATDLYLKDTSRPDPWVPEVKARELMATVWYPASRKARGPKLPYLTPKESELHLKGARISGVPYDILSGTRTHAIKDAAPVAGHEGRLPLVVLSPGFTKPRRTLTGLAEELASRGHIVVGVDHTYESYATTFPDGRVATCVACETDEQPDHGPKTVAIRAADVSFVLDELTGKQPRWPGAALIDRSRIAMVGQSLGGASAVAAMLGDSRVRAGIDMDGTTYAPIPPGALSRPFMLLGNQERHSPGSRDVSWDRDWRLMTGWKRWLVMSGAVHQSFTDVPILLEALGLDSGAEVTGTRSLELTRRYVRAFLDRHLRGKRSPLLDEPSSRYPEMKICAPETGSCR
ncbi:alpha/beta hydrolase [Spongiactinospora sp. TRM90649]|uniref:alpha/beta hydrolase family protein n=1 Tax=Spongiactinospora sp. TRM90649 TaxID=3031114 RepID=UPI0023F6C5A1|nr:alpha/beta hydrolase [Spongiactinospora sp. TRM90649]MDF5757521.1 alpha/beta hydrolase [Spongiactinospora sp. TRM90649]